MKPHMYTKLDRTGAFLIKNAFVHTHAATTGQVANLLRVSTLVLDYC